MRDWIGHRDSRIVERYRHLRGRASKQTMARLEFLGGGGSTPGTGVAKAEDSSTAASNGADGSAGAPANQINRRGVDGVNGSRHGDAGQGEGSAACGASQSPSQ